MKSFLSVAFFALLLTGCSSNSELYEADKKEIAELQASFCSCAKDQFRYTKGEDWKLVVTTCDDQLLSSRHLWFTDAEKEFQKKYPDSSMTSIDWKISKSVVYSALNYCPSFQNKPLSDIDEFMIEYEKVKLQAVENNFPEKVKLIDGISRRLGYALQKGEISDLSFEFDNASEFKKVQPELKALKQFLASNNSATYTVNKVLKGSTSFEVQLFFEGKDHQVIASVIYIVKHAVVYPKILSTYVNFKRD